jgi:prophage regulatory protein
MDIQSTPLRALRLRQVTEKTGISRSQLFRMIKAGEFPPSYHLTEAGGVARWNEVEIDLWLQSKFMEASR